MGNIYTPETIGPRAVERGLKPGDKLWIAGDKMENGPYRQGNSPSNPAVYLRWRDVNVFDKKGKIEDEDLAKAIIKPGQGLSLFIEKVVHANFNYISTQSSQCGKSALAALAKEKGYSDADQIHWFRMESVQVPVGLEVVFDDDPPGHCTLTVTKEMTAKEFLNLVSDRLGFAYMGTDIFGKTS